MGTSATSAEPYLVLIAPASLDNPRSANKLARFFKEVQVARVTVEDCLEHVQNRFALVILAADRARQIANGAKPLVKCDNKPGVTSLREIAKRQVRFNESVEGTIRSYLAEVRARGVSRDRSGSKT